MGKILEELNSQNNAIKFTHEIEQDGMLPFLDILVYRNGPKIEFDVYRKPTSTTRYITADSHHTMNHKMAAFNSMIYRMCRLPLNSQSFDKELLNIKEIATKNGYSEKSIEILVLTSLSPIEPDMKRVPITHHHLAQSLKNTYKKYGKELVPVTKNKLGALLGSTKDKAEKEDMSGVYKIEKSSIETMV